MNQSEERQQPRIAVQPVKRRISIHEIKQALLDQRFRDSLPSDLSEDVQKFLKNPGCVCNHPIYLKVMRKATKQISEYFPQKEVPDADQVEAEMEKLAKNEWQVINCHISELGEELRKLGAGRKQLDIARWQDQVTVVVNHLEGLF
jgi:hypothetical protein